MRLRFLTSTPMDIRRGSGTFVGIRALADALGKLGHEVSIETPDLHLPVYTLERMAFNRKLRTKPDFDLTIGFDLDGYRLPPDAHRVVSLKGVIADEARFERGLTRATMNLQARLERRNAVGAERVIATSRYSAERAQEFYGLAQPPAIVPELIDLSEWRRQLALYPAQPERFTILFVGRLYRRKRVDMLLRAAVELRRIYPEFEVRIVGNGPHAAPLRKLARELRLEDRVTWLGDAPQDQIFAEYNRADVFCLPSIQEGFGIVLLEAMASGKPIVASRAAAIPEVAPYALFPERDTPDFVAERLAQLYRIPALREKLAAKGVRRVERYDAPLVAQQFLDAATGAAAAAAT